MINDPTDISDCELWLAADNIVGLSDGDAVGTWNDESGNGRDATQGTTANKPTYKTNQLNGKPVVRLDGANDTLGFAANFMSGKSAGEMFVVVKLVADPPPSGKTGHPLGMPAGLASHYTWTDGGIYEGWGTNSRKGVGNPTPSLASWRIYGVWSAANDWQASLDGSALLATGTNTVGWDVFTIGNGGQGYTDGDIAEIVVYGRKLTSTERADVLDYFNTKYFTSGTTYSGDLLSAPIIGGYLIK